MNLIPRYACNAHCHIFGPASRFPYATDSPPPRADAPEEALFALNDRLGFARCVIVQSKVHGYDNSAMEAAIAARPHDYRGIALMQTDAAGAEIARLDRSGIRGVRFNYMRHLGVGEPIAQVQALARRIDTLGWHVQVHGDPSIVLGEIVPALIVGPVPIVIDHIARIDAHLGLAQPHFKALCKLMENPRCWVKVSGIDRITTTGPPYTDAIPFARKLVELYPDRVLWGNDWPHPNHQGPIPDDVALAQLIHDIAPRAEQLAALLVDNPHRLYRFGVAS